MRVPSNEGAGEVGEAILQEGAWAKFCSCWIWMRGERKYILIVIENGKKSMVIK